MFQINGRKIGEAVKPYIIAEMSANHSGSIDRAKATIKAAKDCGADAVKLQTYTADTMTIECSKKDFQIQEGLWKGYSLYELYQEASTPFEWHDELFRFASNIGITIFSTPFDESAVELLDSLSTPAFKIASFELVDLPLIKSIAGRHKPILMSTGMGTLEEIAEALEVIKSTGNSQILLFHCVSSYPAPTKQSNLRNIKFLKKEFDIEIGLSDHTISNLAATTSIGLGACAIEKHFKLDGKDEGPDSSFSLSPSQFKSLVHECYEAWAALGSMSFSRPEVEKENTRFRRSLYFVKDLKKGAHVSIDNVRRIRPGYGLPPRFLSDIIGRILEHDVERGDPVSWENFEG